MRLADWLASEPAKVARRTLAVQVLAAYDRAGSGHGRWPSARQAVAWLESTEMATLDQTFELWRERLVWAAEICAEEGWQKSKVIKRFRGS